LIVEVLANKDFATEVGSRLTRAMAGHPGIRLCLATGNTTHPVYRQTRTAGNPAIFLLDEFGGLPPSDPGRCATHFRAVLPQTPFSVPNVDAADPKGSAVEYRAAIDQGGIDLAIVGLGRNGHIGMNEPGSSRDSVTRVVDLAETTRTGAMAYGASARPTWGITVGISELFEARELWLVVSGSHKAEIMETVLRAPIGSDLPASFLRLHPHVRIIADMAAAERV
jgi:glucosamine-6-phosphate deaminase